MNTNKAIINHILPREEPAADIQDCSHHAAYFLTDNNGAVRGMFCPICEASWRMTDIQAALILYEQERANR